MTGMGPHRGLFMYISGQMPVITCSNKLRTYTTARYYTEAEILDIITKGAAGK